MASLRSFDVWEWIQSLAPISQWSGPTLSLCISTTESVSLNLKVIRKLQKHVPEITFSIFVEYSQTPICLWSSKKFVLRTETQERLDEDTSLSLFFNVISGVLRYSPSKNKKSSLGQPAAIITDDFQAIFNISFLTLIVLLCIYEAPQATRQELLENLRLHLTSSASAEATKLLLRALGSNLEAQWMRTVNLGITNWITQLQPSSDHHSASPFPLVSYAISASNLWKVQLFCPLVSMSTEDPSSVTQNERLLFSLRYHQFEGVIQLAPKIVFQESWIEVIVKVDNIRCDVIPLVSGALLSKRGYGWEEKHFPSRVSLQLTPILQSNVLSVSVSKSTDNLVHEVGLDKGIETTFTPPTSLAIGVSASEIITMSIKPWKFEETVCGNSATLNWFLHDGVSGREVSSSRPSVCTALFRTTAWFRNRYSSAYRPFTKQGGVVFAGDEYGETVCWKVCQGALGKSMEWEVKGRIWLSYWPNKCRSSHSETKMVEFTELLRLCLEK